MGLKDLPSSVSWPGISFTTGGSLTGFTVNFTFTLAFSPAGSNTFTVTVSLPFQNLFGISTVSTPFSSMLKLISCLTVGPLAFVAFLPVPEAGVASSIVHLSSSSLLSGSVTNLLKSTGANVFFSSMTNGCTGFRVGGSFTGITSNEALVEALAPDGSLTVKTSVSLPFHVGFGVSTMARLPFTSTLRSLLPVTVHLSSFGLLSGSVATLERSIGSNFSRSLILWPAIAFTTGGSLTGVTS